MTRSSRQDAHHSLPRFVLADQLSAPGVLDDRRSPVAGSCSARMVTSPSASQERRRVGRSQLVELRKREGLAAKVARGQRPRMEEPDIDALNDGARSSREGQSRNSPGAMMAIKLSISVLDHTFSALPFVK